MFINSVYFLYMFGVLVSQMPDRKVIAFLLAVLCVCPEAGLAQAHTRAIALPAPGEKVLLSPAFTPNILRGIKVHPNDPLNFDFILDVGDSVIARNEVTTQSKRLIKYFLTALTVPDKDLWVNLSPYEPDRIIPTAFGRTEMGWDVLAEDYLLKQITATLMDPESERGRAFWQKVYAQAAQELGNTAIPVNTFHKVWIVPDKAVMYENAAAGTAYIVEARLKVMLEEDYVARDQHTPVSGSPKAAPAAKEIVQEFIIPQLEKEVNEGQNFAALRQIYHALILAAWYKKKIKESVISLSYAGQNKVLGLEYDGAKAGDIALIYERYLQAFKKGVYNYIKEEADPATGRLEPRKYFAGGAFLGNVPMEFRSSLPSTDLAQTSVSVRLEPMRYAANDAGYKLEKRILDALKIPAEKLFRSETRVNGKAIPITRYKNTKSEITPYLRVGPYVVVGRKEWESFDEDIKNDPYVIVKGSDLITMDAWINADMEYDVHRGWAGYMIGVLASMIGHQDAIKGSSFIDFGAGSSGIVGILAHKLGAAEVILIEGNEQYAEQLERNLTENGVPKDKYVLYHTVNFKWMPNISTKNFGVTFVLDLHGYGADQGNGELSGVIELMHKGRKNVQLAVVSGGPESESYMAGIILRTLVPAEQISRVVVPHGERSPGRIPTTFTTLVGRPDAAMAGGSTEQRQSPNHTKLLKALNGADKPMTITQLTHSTGLTKRQIDGVLRNAPTMRDHKNIKIRKFDTTDRLLQALEGATQPLTLQQLSFKTKISIHTINYLVKTKSELRNHKKLKIRKLENRMVWTAEEIKAIKAEVERRLDNQEGIQYSVSSLAEAVGMERELMRYYLISWGYLDHEKIIKRKELPSRIEKVINKISDTGLNAEGKVKILLSLRYRSMRVFTREKAEQLVKKIDLPNRLRLMERLLNLKHGKRYMFTRAQAYAIAEEYVQEKEDEVYKKIEWLANYQGGQFFSIEHMIRLAVFDEKLVVIQQRIKYLRSHGFRNPNNIVEMILGGSEIEYMNELLKIVSDTDPVQEIRRMNLQREDVNLILNNGAPEPVSAGSIRHALMVVLSRKKIPLEKIKDVNAALRSAPIVIRILDDRGHATRVSRDEMEGYHLESGDLIDINLPVDLMGDPAQVSSLKGGIDLNLESMSMITSGDNIELNTDAAALHALHNASGLTPIIVATRPITSLSAFLTQ